MGFSLVVGVFVAIVADDAVQVSMGRVGRLGFDGQCNQAVCVSPCVQQSLGDQGGRTGNFPLDIHRPLAACRPRSTLLGLEAVAWVMGSSRNTTASVSSDRAPPDKDYRSAGPTGRGSLPHGRVTRSGRIGRNRTAKANSRTPAAIADTEISDLHPVRKVGGPDRCLIGKQGYIGAVEGCARQHTGRAHDQPSDRSPGSCGC